MNKESGYGKKVVNIKPVNKLYIANLNKTIEINLKFLDECNIA